MSLFLGFRALVFPFHIGGLRGGIGLERENLRRVGRILREIEEMLGAGLVPPSERWQKLRSLPAPWGALAFDSLQELRARGGALLPTLRRLRALAEQHDRGLGEARARASQSLSQALVCAALVPVFGTALYLLLPSVSARPWIWFASCSGSLMLAGSGALWMLKMAEEARWAGLRGEARSWMLASQCAGERFLALVRSGSPADLAWVRACELLKADAPGLAARWGASVWLASGTSFHSNARCPAEGALEETGDSLRRAVQVSLMEGSPCTDRVESALAGLSGELAALVERELSLLATRSLKPLFMCVAPALFALLAIGMGLSWGAVSGGEGGF